MKTPDENRITMTTTTLGVITKYKDLWEEHVAVADVVTSLTAKVESIQEQALIAAGNSGATKAKKLALTNLVQSALEIIGAVQSYANKNELPELWAKVNYKPTALVQGRARVVVDRAYLIHAAAESVGTNLADYRITPAKLTAFKKRIETFDGIKTSPREAVVQRKGANEQIPDLVRDAMQLLRQQLDGLLIQFKQEHPNFYEEYFAARKIVDRRGGQATLTDKHTSSFNTPSTPTPAKTPAPVPA